MTMTVRHRLSVTTIPTTTKRFSIYFAICQLPLKQIRSESLIFAFLVSLFLQQRKIELETFGLN